MCKRKLCTYNLQLIPTQKQLSFCRVDSACTSVANKPVSLLCVEFLASLGSSVLQCLVVEGQHLPLILVSWT